MCANDTMTTEHHSLATTTAVDEDHHDHRHWIRDDDLENLFRMGDLLSPSQEYDNMFDLDVMEVEPMYPVVQHKLIHVEFDDAGVGDDCDDVTSTTEEEDENDGGCSYTECTLECVDAELEWATLQDQQCRAAAAAVHHGDKLRRVRFDCVDIREYNVIVGDHPYCRDSCPLTLDWVHTDVTRKDIGTFENQRWFFRSGGPPCPLTLGERRLRILETNGLGAGDEDVIVQLEWYMKFQGVLNEIVDLHRRHSLGLDSGLDSAV